MHFLCPKSISGALYHKVTTWRKKKSPMFWSLLAPYHLWNLWINAVAIWPIQFPSAVLVGVSPQWNLGKRQRDSVVLTESSSISPRYRYPHYAPDAASKLSLMKLSAQHRKDEQDQNQLALGAGQLNQPARSGAWSIEKASEPRRKTSQVSQIQSWKLQYMDTCHHVRNAQNAEKHRDSVRLSMHLQVAVQNLSPMAECSAPEKSQSAPRWQNLLQTFYT